MHRFYWPPDDPPITAEGTAVRGDLLSHFAATRLEDGEAVECFNEEGLRAGCRVKRDGRRWLVALAPEVALLPAPVLSRKVAVWMATFDPARFDWAAEKLTELGVSEIGAFKSDRSNAQVRSEDRLRRVMIRAAEQCGRIDIPRYGEAKSLKEIATEGSLVLEIPGRVVTEPLSSVALALAIRLIVGPEGGWSDAEKEWLATAPVKFVHLVPSVLRAETAAIAAASIALSR